MRPNLMPLLHHPSHQRLILLSQNTTPIIAIHKERSRYARRFERVEDLTRVDVWAVVESERHNALLSAARDNGAGRHCAVGDSLRGESHARSRGLRGGQWTFSSPWRGAVAGFDEDRWERVAVGHEGAGEKGKQ